MSLKAQYRYGTIFRDIYEGRDSDLCGVLDGSSSNLLIKATVESIKESVPQLIHDCPYNTVRSNLIDQQPLTQDRFRACTTCRYP